MRNHGANMREIHSHSTWTSGAPIAASTTAMPPSSTTSSATIMRRSRGAGKSPSVTTTRLRRSIRVRLPPAPNADPRYFDIYQNYEFCHPAREAAAQIPVRQQTSARSFSGVGSVFTSSGIWEWSAICRKQTGSSENPFCLPLNHIPNGRTGRSCGVHARHIFQRSRHAETVP
jgi:hypothetical protein